MATAKKKQSTQIDRQLNGMRGVYLAAAELCVKGYIATVTSRNMPGPDIIVTDKKCMRTFAVQVKTNTKTFSFWLIGKNKMAPTTNYVFILINIRKDKEQEFYIVPSEVVAKKTTTDAKGNWESFSCRDAKDYKNNWKIFEG